MTAQLVRKGETLTGRIDSPMGFEDVRDGRVEGDSLTWAMEIKKPMPMTVTFEAKVEGDAMAGKVKLGVFGTADLSGRRI